MKFLEKISQKNSDLYGAEAATIAFLGDSVTQGCFECYFDGDRLETVFDGQNAFSEKFRNLLNLLYPRAQINVINAGISGGNAAGGLARYDRDVGAFRPDLVVVGFALNDCCAGKELLERYTESLAGIFGKASKQGAECIYLTPNRMCNKVSGRLTDARFVPLAESFMRVQNEGILDEYVEAGKACAGKNGAAVCDVYGKWMRMANSGADMTALLANGLNHPIRELGELTAFALLDTIFEN